MLQLSSDRVRTLIVFIVSLPMLDCQSNMLSSRVVRLGYEKSQLHRTDVKLVTAGQNVGDLQARRRGMSKSKGHGHLIGRRSALHIWRDVNGWG
jgi:hypothetical protein